MIPFARWLRQTRPFPIRVPVYLCRRPHVVTVDGRRASASFFAPWDTRVEPYIRVATGDFEALRRRWGRNGATVSYLISLAHEVLHYEQWVQGRALSERGVPRRAGAMVKRYLEAPRNGANGDEAA